MGNKSMKYIFKEKLNKVNTFITTHSIFCEGLLAVLVGLAVKLITKMGW